MKRYRYILKKQGDMLGTAYSVSTLTEALREGKSLKADWELEDADYVLYIQKFEAGEHITIAVFTRKAGPRSKWQEKPDYAPF